MGMEPKQRWKQRWHTIGINAAAFLKWTAIAVLTGLAVGVVGAVFHHALEWANHTRQENGWLVLWLPSAGMLLMLLYRWCGMERDRGTNFVVMAVRENEPMRLRTAPLIFLSTVLTQLTGGSAGREGAALQLGGALSGQLGRWLRLDEKEARMITLCGMAAGFSALFGTPLAAAVFSMEMVSVGVMYYAALYPCVLSALTARLVAGAMGAQATAFQLADVPEPGPLVLLQVGGLGVLCALLSIAFCVVIHITPKLYNRATADPVLQAILGGSIVLTLTFLSGTQDYNGAGMEVIARAIGGQAVWSAFLWKMVLTAATLGAGYRGGEIVPVFFTGATFGCVAGELLGLAPSFAAGVGMVAVFCGVTNCPMASMLLYYELFGGQGMGLFALACAISYMLSGYYGLYSEQKILYSKLRPEFVDRKTR